MRKWSSRAHRTFYYSPSRQISCWNLKTRLKYHHDATSLHADANVPNNAVLNRVARVLVLVHPKRSTPLSICTSCDEHVDQSIVISRHDRIAVSRKKLVKNGTVFAPLQTRARLLYLGTAGRYIFHSLTSLEGMLRASVKSLEYGGVLVLNMWDDEQLFSDHSEIKYIANTRRVYAPFSSLRKEERVVIVTQGCRVTVCLRNLLTCPYGRYGTIQHAKDTFRQQGKGYYLGNLCVLRHKAARLGLRIVHIEEHELGHGLKTVVMALCISHEKVIALREMVSDAQNEAYSIAISPRHACDIIGEALRARK